MFLQVNVRLLALCAVASLALVVLFISVFLLFVAVPQL